MHYFSTSDSTLRSSHGERTYSASKSLLRVNAPAPGSYPGKLWYPYVTPSSPENPIVSPYDPIVSLYNLIYQRNKPKPPNMCFSGKGLGCIGRIEEKMETTVVYSGSMGIVEKNGNKNGTCCRILELHKNDGKEHGNYFSILGLNITN